MRCNNPRDAVEFVQCSEDILNPVLELVYPILGIAITTTILIVGIRFTKSVIREFTASEYHER